MSAGIGGKLRSRWTSVEWLTSYWPTAEIAQQWHFLIGSFAGSSPGTSADAGTLDGYTPGGLGGAAWSTLAGSLQFGYGLYWVLRIEGIPTLFVEALADAIAPAGYDLDASLVIDRSARLGSLVDGDSHIAKAFDLEARLLDSAIVRTYMTRPARVTTLAADLGADDTTMSVAKTADFDGLDELYIGASCIPFAGSTADSFTGLGRDAYGRRRSYKKGSLVTDGPYTFQGRRADLFAVVLDPAGRYVQTSHILDTATMWFSGYIAERPVRDGTEWVFEVRDQVRRLADPVGITASGTAVWEPDDDALVDVPTEAVLAVEFELKTTGTIVSCNVAPFAAMSGQARKSALRQAILDALTAATTIGTSDGEVRGFFWRTQSDPVRRTVEHHLMVQFNPAVGDTSSTLVYGGLSPNGVAEFYSGGAFGSYDEACEDTAGTEERSLLIFQLGSAHGVSLAVILDEGDPASLPPEGWIVIEAAGRSDYARYTSAMLDDTDPMKVHLTLDDADRIAGQELDAVLAGDRATASVRFLWSDSGELADILRRAITSTGDAQHGAYDKLPKGQGLGLPYVDLESFDAVFGGGIGDLNFQIAVDAGTSLAETFDGFLRFSRRALVSRMASDGSRVNIAAVDIGPVDDLVPVSVITPDMLVTTQGRRPVRVKRSYAAPQTIKVSCRTIAAGDAPEAEGVITYRDQHLLDWTGTKWDLDLHGIAREDVKTLGEGWATSWFRAGETRQIIEIDLPPDINVRAAMLVSTLVSNRERTPQVGDVVSLHLDDPSVWDYAAGTVRYSDTHEPFLARVLGYVMSLDTAIVTLTVAVDGIYGAGPMSPSIPIAAVNGGATTPTSIDVAPEYYDLLVEIDRTAENPHWKILAYRPGYDDGHAEYVISQVTLTSGMCRLGVVTYPSAPAVSLDTTWRLTWTVVSECTGKQAQYLQNTDGTQWG